MQEHLVVGLVANWFLKRDSTYLNSIKRIMSSFEKLPEWLSTFYGGFIGIQLDFIVMHELQHILSGHIENCRTIHMSARSENTLDILERSIQQEYEADTKDS